jgi:hypothetical protein
MNVLDILDTVHACIIMIYYNTDSSSSQWVAELEMTRILGMQTYQNIQ